MNKIAVITDTDSSLPLSLAGQYGIQLVPITVHFEDSAVFTTGVDIDDRQLSEMVDRRKKLPTTSDQIAYEMFPGRDISVIDSLNLSMEQGFMALAV